MCTTRALQSSSGDTSAPKKVSSYEVCQNLQSTVTKKHFIRHTDTRILHNNIQTNWPEALAKKSSFLSNCVKAVARLSTSLNKHWVEKNAK